MASAVAVGTSAAVIAGVETPAFAAGGTGSQLFACTNLLSADANAHTAPIKVSVATDASWPASASSAGQVIPLTATVTLGIPSEVIAGLKTSGGAHNLGISGSRLHLHLTNATPSDVIVNVGAAARVALPASGPLNFTFTGVSLGNVTTAGTSGGAVSMSIDTSVSDDGFGIDPDGYAGPGQANFGYLQTLGANAPHGNCIADADATANGAGGTALIDYTTADNAPAIGSFSLTSQTPPPAPPAKVKTKTSVSVKKGHISGKVTAGKKGVAGVSVTLYMKVKGKWKKVATVKTNSSGAYKFGKLKKSGTYEVVTGKQKHGGKNYVASTSKSVKVKV
jgi:hypothetical protein